MNARTFIGRFRGILAQWCAELLSACVCAAASADAPASAVFASLVGRGVPTNTICISGDAIWVDFSSMSEPNLAALCGLPIDVLFLAKASVSNWSCLRDCFVRRIECSRTSLADLDCLNVQPLRALNISGTQVSDLSPLVASSLESLSLEQTLVRDLSPLKAVPLKVVSFDPVRITNGLDVLRSMKTLELINVLKPVDFWKMYNGSTPPQDLLTTDPQIAGKWGASDGRYTGTAMSLLSEGDDNEFDVKFRSWGCAAEHRYHRKGKFVGGVLKLNRAVQDSMGLYYDRLYAVRIDGTNYLVPSAIAHELQGRLTEDRRHFLDGDPGPDLLKKMKNVEGEWVVPRCSVILGDLP